MTDINNLAPSFLDANGKKITPKTEIADTNLLDPNANWLKSWDSGKPDLGEMKLPEGHVDLTPCE